MKGGPSGPRPPTANRVDARFAVVLSAVAFALSFAWENAQCSAFFVHSEAAPTQVDMVRATLGDVVMTWIAYAIAAAASGRLNWPFQEWGARRWLTLLGVALAMSVSVERFALATGRWTYTANNPLIPGLGVSVLPVAQLVLLFPAAFRLAVWLAARRPEAR